MKEEHVLIRLQMDLLFVHFFNNKISRYVNTPVASGMLGFEVE